VTIEELLKAEQQKEQARLAINLKHMENGVTFFDWKTAYIEDAVQIGQGTTIGPGVILTGNTVIGVDCSIGQNSRIEDSSLGNQVQVEASIILKSQVGDRSKIGPFAYLRPNCRIGEDAKIGDFVEVKNSIIGNGSKASHLTYIGDSDVGKGVNLGCGVVFVNYDGALKHRSVVEDGAFIGCNTNLISPVTVGEKAYIAAGTTVTKDVPAGALCVGREKDRCIAGWVEKRGLLKKKK
jgi:bifunctional UDP-N-acetylglucosamine pyrophosphorylase/glucosamine-1-phosphate N-acetyltransferase